MAERQPECPGCYGRSAIAVWLEGKRKGWECLDAVCHTRWSTDPCNEEAWRISAIEQGIGTLPPRR